MVITDADRKKLFMEIHSPSKYLVMRRRCSGSAGRSHGTLQFRIRGNRHRQSA